MSRGQHCSLSPSLPVPRPLIRSLKWKWHMMIPLPSIVSNNLLMYHLAWLWWGCAVWRHHRVRWIPQGVIWIKPWTGLGLFVGIATWSGSHSLAWVLFPQPACGVDGWWLCQTRTRQEVPSGWGRSLHLTPWWREFLCQDEARLPDVQDSGYLRPNGWEVHCRTTVTPSISTVVFGNLQSGGFNSKMEPCCTAVWRV